MNPIFCFRGVVCLFLTGRNELTKGRRHLSDNEFVRSCVPAFLRSCLGGFVFHMNHCPFPDHNPKPTNPCKLG